MRALLPIFLLVVSTPLAADPPKPASTAATTTATRPALLMLASNETARPGPARDAEQPQPPKHRIARVTTCRCGDPQPDSESGSEQQ